MQAQEATGWQWEGVTGELEEPVAGRRARGSGRGWAGARAEVQRREQTALKTLEERTAHRLSCVAAPMAAQRSQAERRPCDSGPEGASARWHCAWRRRLPLVEADARADFPSLPPPLLPAGVLFLGAVLAASAAGSDEPRAPLEVLVVPGWSSICTAETVQVLEALAEDPGSCPPAH